MKMEEEEEEKEVKKVKKVVVKELSQVQWTDVLSYYVIVFVKSRMVSLQDTPLSYVPLRRKNY